MSPQQTAWYPGLMARTRRFLDRYLKHLDVILEVTDARAPRSCRWHGLDEVLQGKPRILILNKADLADTAVTAEWQAFHEAASLPAVPVSAAATGAAARDQARRLREMLRSMAGTSSPLRAVKVAAVGVPNAGKSSVLNLIGGRRRAATGARPGLTRGQQWIVLSGGIWLLDLPGVLPPAPRDQRELSILAAVGTLPEGAYDTPDVALLLLAAMAAHPGPAELAKRLKLGPGETGFAGAGEREPVDWLKAWALRRGALAAGGEPDFARAAAMLVAEFRRGGFGRVSLERPEHGEADALG